MDAYTSIIMKIEFIYFIEYKQKLFLVKPLKKIKEEKIYCAAIT